MLSMFAKNLQSILAEHRFADFVQELETILYDIALFNETWRKEREEILCLPTGGHLYFSGGSKYRGVGIGMSAKFGRRMLDVRFQSFLHGYVLWIFNWRADYSGPLRAIFQLLGILTTKCKKSTTYCPFFSWIVICTAGFR